MKKQLVYGSIVLMSLALAGLVCLQFYWIRHAYRLKEEQFDRQVHDVLNVVAGKLEKKEMQMAVISRLNIVDDELLKGQDRDDKRPKFVRSDTSSILFTEVRSMHYSGVSDSAGKEGVAVQSIIRVDSILRAHKGSVHREALLLRPPMKGNVQVIDTQRAVSGKKMQLGDVLNKIAVELSFNDKSLLDRVGKDSLQVLLRDELQSRSIDTSCSIALLEGAKDTIAVKGKIGEGEVFSVKLFPMDVVNKPGYLLLGFTGKEHYILHSMVWLLGVSLFFTLIILAAFASGVFVMLRQKRMAEIRADFINNMTHEFKTPIATISLAADALDNPQVQGNSNLMHTYTAMIREENRRMNRQVEQVLQMALAEKKELVLHLNLSDVQALVQPVIDKMQLQAKVKGGMIHLEIPAALPKVQVDEMHFRNVLFNLVDNAIKYAEKIPEVKVKVYLQDMYLCIEVSDNGVGMSSEQQAKIFEPFYRVPTGNLHPVKGFGLGLSYSRAVIEAHKGRLDVQSEPGKGSVFTIVLHI